MEHTVERARQPGLPQKQGTLARKATAPAVPLHPMLQLQRDIGNQAVARLVQSRSIQTKLTVGSSDDPLEHEADQVADQVMRRSAKAAGCSCEAGGSETCETCKSQLGPSGTAPEVRRSAQSNGAGSPAPPIVHQALRGTGQPLDSFTRKEMEASFDRDFRDVRVHTDNEAAESAGAINALAYTAGNNVVFGKGQFAPRNPDGKRLLAHELAHVVQQGAAQTIRRQADPKADLVESPPKAQSAHDATLHQWPTTGERVMFAGIELTEDPNQLQNVVWHLIGFGYPELMIPPGIGAASDFEFRIQSAAFRWAAGEIPCPAPGEPGYEDCHRSQVLRDRIVMPFSQAVATAYDQCEIDLTRFEMQARNNALNILAANEHQTREEARHYGIEIKTLESDYDFEGYPTPPITLYSMDSNSSGAADLRKAAQLLLKRREAIYAKRDEQDDHYFSDPMSGLVFFDDQYESIGKEVEGLEGEYNASRTILATQFPLLAAFSELDPTAVKKGDSELRQIAETAPGQDIARLLGRKIHDTLEDIEESRDGLDPTNDRVNVWTLEDIVNLTKAQFGADSDPVLSALVSEKVKEEQPGILHDIALGVLNIAAILLAPETGGLSLAVAAGVNVAVTASHIQDYLTQKALAGSAFDRARALSREDPSLFWLAFEIVGTVFDVGGAAAAVSEFRAIAPLAKSAIAAKEGKEATEGIEALRFAAQEVKDAKFAEEVVANVKAARAGETSLKGFEEEGKLLQEAGKASEFASAPQKAGRVIEEEAIAAEHLATDTFEEGGHTYQILKDGRIVRCSKWCADIEFLFEDLFKSYPQLADSLTAAKLLKGKEAEEAVRLLTQRLNLVRRAEKMSLEEVEALIRTGEFPIRTPMGIDLRYLRYLKEEKGSLPFEAWLKQAENVWKIGELGPLTERELKAAYDLGPKNFAALKTEAGEVFIPDHVAGAPKTLVQGQPYHFTEIKDWANMSDTGNLSRMLDYVSAVDGSRITIFFRSNTYMSGPLTDRIVKLVATGRAELIPFLGR